MSTPEKITSEIQKLAPSAVIELYIMDSTSIGGDVLRFHAGTNGLNQNLVFDGETYVRYPVQVTGFEYEGKGQFPRPKLTVSNAFSAITTVLMQFNDLIGAKVTRRRTLKKYLDAVNFPGGVNPDADSSAVFEDDIYYIDRKSVEDKDVVEFELAASIDIAGIALPRRQVIQNVCIWKYRGAECGYTGPPIYDAEDNRILTAATSEGQAVIDSYGAYLAAEAALAAAETNLTQKNSSKESACEWLRLETRYSTSAPTYIVRYLNGTLLAAAWNGVAVTLGATYKVGKLRNTSSAAELGTITEHEIERWGYDTAGCSTATTTYNTALADRDSKKTARDNAITAYEDALAALPVDDPLWLAERCGKRLTSCEARFGINAPLPFGGFPSSGLFR